MARPNLKQVAWQLRQHLGWSGVLGVVLLLASALFCASAVRGQVLERARLDASWLTLAADYRVTGASATAPTSREQRLQEFYGFFPPLAALPEVLDHIYLAAEHNGMQFDSGEYALKREQNWQLARYEITFPLKGSYTQVRGFIAEVLNKVPAAALEEAVFKRDAIGTDALEARLRLTLFLRAEP